MSRSAYVYILNCADGTYYTGYTLDLDGRLTLHRSGRASKYTRSRLPVRLVYAETCESRSAAMRRERQIKQLPRAKKTALINGKAD